MAYCSVKFRGDGGSCWENSSKGPPYDRTMLDHGFLQLDDLVWDNLQESDDHIVPEPDQDSEIVRSPPGDRRKKLYRKQAHSSGESSGLSSQQSFGSNTTLKNTQEETSRADLGTVITSESMLRSRPPITPVMWNDLINGADHATKRASPQQTAFSPPGVLSGRESISARDDVKVELLMPGSGDLGVYMADSLYSEDDASIVTTSCQFTLGDVDPEESGLPLFGGVSDDSKVDYNWDHCFGFLEDVDNLLSSGPDSAFGPVTSSPDGMQWHDSPSPPAVQPDSHLSKARSPPGTDCGAAVKGKLDVFDMKMEIVPIDTPLPLPPVEKAHLSFKDSEFLPASNYDSRLQNSHIQEELSAQQLGAQFNARDGLHDEKMVQGIAWTAALLENNDDTSIGMEITEEDSGPSSVSLSDSEKVRMAQAHRARRHAVNRKRCEERTKRQLNHRKILQGPQYGSPQAPQMLQPMPIHLSTQTGHLHQSSSPALHGYAATPSTLAPLQPMMRPTYPYIHVGYCPPMHLLPPVAPTTVPAQMQAQGLYVGYQQPSPFQQPLSHAHQQQLRPPGEVAIRPATSTPTMTPQEKIEKLRFLQQMQARFAVEQQQQQFAAQGVAPLDPSALRKQLPQGLGMSQLDVTATTSEVKMAVSESDIEPSLSVGQTSVEATSDDEGGSLEAVVLERLQNTIKSLEVGTKLCIRDALYRLARSAMKRQASGGRSSDGDAATSSQASEDADATSTGLETSINSDPSSSSRVSRMNMNTVETQTNPIDRSVAHLLFHKRQSQPAASGQFVPSSDGARLAPLQTGLAEPSSMSPRESFPHGNWAGVSQLIPLGGAAQGIVAGIEMGPVHLLRPPMASVAATPVSRLQDGAVLGTTETLKQETGILSPLATESPLTGGHLQSNVVGTGMSSAELPSPMGAHSCNETMNEQRVSRTQGVRNSVQKDPSEVRSGLRSKRLQHATGLKELSQLLTEGLDVRSALSCKEDSVWAQSGPPLSTSIGSDELQAGSLSEGMNDLGGEEGPKIHQE